MLVAFKNLEKILIQEKKLGYQNKAVIGGLERFVQNWFPQALKEATTKAERLTIEKIAAGLKSYGNHTPGAERETAIDTILSYLNDDTSTVVPGRDEAEKAEPVETAPEPLAEEPPRPQPAPSQPAPSPKKPARSLNVTKLTYEQSVEGLASPVTRLPGIKQANAKKLERLEVTTVGDLLTLYPRRYDDYRTLKTINNLTYDEDVTIIAQVWQTSKRQPKPNINITSTILSDGTGTIEATWFNQPWLQNKLTPGKQIVVSGRVNQYLGRLIFQSPEWEPLDKTQTHTGRLVPIYPLTTGISATWLRTLQKRTVDYWARRLPDPLPESIRERLDLLSLDEAVREIHFPESWESLEAARRRLAFDELLMIQLGVLKQRQLWKAQEGSPVQVDQNVVDNFVQTLPFELTKAQQRVLAEILEDLGRTTPMSRLLQGDVGSGKTVVALAAMLAVMADHGQSAILAPTEILAEQHLKSMSRLLELAGLTERVNIQLLTGSTKTAERNTILAGLAEGTVHLLVGTHAIIQEDVAFQNLKLAIIDEQHRFGVEQRSALRQKGLNPHMLVMSATPIPRSLALTLFGDLDLSIIDEMPAGRQEIKTRWLSPLERERAYSFLRSQIEKGRQAFIICPLVEESDKIEAKSAVQEHERLQKTIFPNLKLGLLHGRLSAKDKETVMADFRDRKTDMLVSTSVVEVGIDIPNASTILIEGANRFGLAQLHQFRGRVGRGEHQSYCLLLADDAGPEAKARLEVMERTNDGFELAEEDLKLRGPGEFFGTRQSGMPNLKLVKLSDTKLLELARQEAKAIYEQDPMLEKPDHAILAASVNAFWLKITDAS